MSDPPVNRQLEQEELAEILSSGIFARAPGLAQFLQYVCEKHFRGEADSLKEYNIAVDALGRPADFDQKRDSIVRVEAHRLRKRLRQYYSTDGANRPIQIDLPPGGYAPVFIVKDHGRMASGNPEQPVSRSPWPRRLAIGGTAAVLVLATIGTWQWRSSADSAGPTATIAHESVGPAAAVSEIRIQCGSSTTYTDRGGRVWIPDRYFEGGRAGRNDSQPVQGSLNGPLYQAWREGTFSYRIPLKPGTYEVWLFFSEPYFGAGPQAAGSETNRLFDVKLNGATVIREMDIVAEAGDGWTMVGRLFRDVKPTTDGLLNLEFVGSVNGALVNGIAVVPGTEGRIRPIRIAARESAYTDSAGRLWGEDRFFKGGKLVKRIEGITGTEDPELYRGERFGRFSYTIPVPPDSTYTAVLHFAETWFGGSGVGGAGSRLFDVFCNGSRLLENYDLFAEAGGPFRATQRVFRGLKPTPNGKLFFQFIPSKNYAMLNAIEILDEATGSSAVTAQRRLTVEDPRDTRR